MGDIGVGMYILVLYDGDWKKNGDSFTFDGSSSCMILLRGDITHAELVDMVYEEIHVDRCKYELVLKVRYNTVEGFAAAPTIVNGDMQLAAFMAENHHSRASNSGHIPLCVTLVEKCLGVQNAAAIGKEVSSFGRRGVEFLDGNIREQQSMDLEFDSAVGAIQDSTAESWDSTRRIVESRVNDRIVVAEPSFEHSYGNSESSYFGGGSFSGIIQHQNDVYVGVVFTSKADLRFKVHKLALDRKFDVKVYKSSPTLLVMICSAGSTCTWRLRAAADVSNLWVISKYEEYHSCSILDTRQNSKRQAAAWVIGELVKPKFREYNGNVSPRTIINEMKSVHGIDIGYCKAWRSRERALVSIRGTIEESYQKLPSMLYMLEQKNHGTLTHIETDESGHFRYMFMALGQCIRGFQQHLRRVICVDGCFLKHKIGGQMLVAIALDANEQLYPVAVGVVDSENNESWDYFMSKLRVALGYIPGLVFVSDRHKSIANALSVHFPEAYHGACIYHLKMNILARFKTDMCNIIFEKAARDYRPCEFDSDFERIRLIHPGIASYLENDVGLEKWARAHFPGMRYNQMTSNYAESFNSKCREARKYPIAIMLEYVRVTIQEWFRERREKADNGIVERSATVKDSPPEHRLAPHYEQLLQEEYKGALHYNVQPLNLHQYHVLDGALNGEVDMSSRVCSCRVFQLRGIPCKHALAVSRCSSWDGYSLCSRYYTLWSWSKCYEETIYPLGHEADWNVPNEVKERICLAPIVKAKRGRTTTKRKPSRGEFPKKPKMCGSCGQKGHNRSTCRSLMPSVSTVSSTSRAQL